MKFEKQMERFVVRFVLGAVLTAGAVIAVAASYRTQITCPIDGQYMSFDHFGPGSGAEQVCWYSHDWYDSDAHKTVHHTAYAPCGN
jgi:hypothetical protein